MKIIYVPQNMVMVRGVGTRFSPLFLCAMAIIAVKEGLLRYHAGLFSGHSRTQSRKS